MTNVTNYGHINYTASRVIIYLQNGTPVNFNLGKHVYSVRYTAALLVSVAIAMPF